MQHQLPRQSFLLRSTANVVPTYQQDLHNWYIQLIALTLRVHVMVSTCEENDDEVQSMVILATSI